jgi:hypothetical protein
MILYVSQINSKTINLDLERAPHQPPDGQCANHALEKLSTPPARVHPSLAQQANLTYKNTKFFICMKSGGVRGVERRADALFKNLHFAS